MYQHKPSTVGISMGAFGVAFAAITTTLLVLVPQELMGPAASSAYIETWSRPIMMIGEGVLVYGLPLLSAAFAYYLATKNHSVKSVVVGFTIGGVVLLLGDAILSVVVVHSFTEDPAIDRSLLTHIYRNVSLGGRLIVGALVGAIGATIVGERM